MSRFFLPIASLALAQAFQQPSPPAHDSNLPVHIDVVVRRNNLPVSGLTETDFRVLDERKVRQLAPFVAQGPMAAPNRPGLPTNRPGNGPPGSITVVLIDTVNTRLADETDARVFLLTCLRRIDAGDRVAVYVLGSKLRVLNDFTGDAHELVASLASLADSSSAAGQPLDPISKAFRLATSEAAKQYSLAERTEITAAALETIASHLAGIPGRHNLIWITAAFPMVAASLADERTFSAATLRELLALDEARFTVYPVDTRRLVSKPLSTLPTAPPASLPRPPISRQSAPVILGTGGLRSLASNTGGIAFDDPVDLRKALRAAADDAASAYTLTFNEDAADLNSRFHELKVELYGKGAQLRYRRLYLAMRRPPLTPERRAVAIAEALTGPLMSAQIGLTGIVEAIARPDGAKPGGRRIVAYIDPRDITLTPRDRNWDGLLDCIFSQRSETGQELAVAKVPLSISLDPAQHDTAMKNGLSIARSLDIVAGVTEVRLLVVDRATGRLGSLILPMLTPPATP